MSIYTFPKLMESLISIEKEKWCVLTLLLEEQLVHIVNLFVNVSIHTLTPQHIREGLQAWPITSAKRSEVSTVNQNKLHLFHILT